ncbi:MAG: hypothetical protein ACYTF6_07410 [Planctomycetota bacterium]|jgi:hypothetical protein
MCVLIASAALIVGGCGLFEKNPGEPETVEVAGAGAPAQAGTPADLWLPAPQVKPPISDVPVPVGFKIDEDKSRNYAVAGVRFVDHLYKGRENKFELKRFFERYMVMNRWKLVRFNYAQARLKLDFEKDYEGCRVEIWEAGVFSPTKISVLLWPNKAPATEGEVPKT